MTRDDGQVAPTSGSPDWLQSGWDLAGVVAGAAALTAVVLALPSQDEARAVLGAPFVLFLPGYALLAALFPRRDEIDAGTRIVLSVAFSMVAVILLCLALNFLPWGVRLRPVLFAIDIFLVPMVMAAFLRRRSARDFAGTRERRRLRTLAVKSAPVLAVAALIAAGAFAAHLASDATNRTRGLTEFYLLGPDATIGAYPGVTTQGDEALVILGVANREGESSAYRISVRAGADVVAEIDDFRLTDGGRWEKAIALTPAQTAGREKVQFLLYRKGASTPYRSLHLWLDVEARPAPAPSPTPTPRPTDTLAENRRPAPTPTPRPRAPTLHSVAGGENLTFISDRYGVPLPIVIDANPVPNPDLIFPGQQFVIPSNDGSGG